MSEKSNETRISEELGRISIYFKDVDENQRAIITPLLQNSAFMKVTLEDLQQLIIADGMIDTYQNGATQSGTKPSATLQSYINLMKNYTTVIRTLSKMLPKEQGGTLAEFMEKYM